TKYRKNPWSLCVPVANVLRGFVAIVHLHLRAITPSSYGTFTRARRGIPRSHEDSETGISHRDTEAPSIQTYRKNLWSLCVPVANVLRGFVAIVHLHLRAITPSSYGTFTRARRGCHGAT